MFEGFRSRCCNPSSCARCTASHTSRTIRARCRYSSERPTRLRSKPSTYSIRSSGGRAPALNSRTRTMCGSSNSARARASRRNASTDTQSVESARSTLPATTLPSVRSSSLKTSPAPPLPIRSIVRNPSNIGRGSAARSAGVAGGSRNVSSRRYSSTSARTPGSRSGRSAHHARTSGSTPSVRCRSTHCSNRASTSGCPIIDSAARSSAPRAPARAACGRRLPSGP